MMGAEESPLVDGSGVHHGVTAVAGCTVVSVQMCQDTVFASCIDMIVLVCQSCECHCADAVAAKV